MRMHIQYATVMRCVIMTDGQPLFYHLNNISKFYMSFNLYPHNKDLLGIFTILSDNVGNDFDNPLKIVKK